MPKIHNYIVHDQVGHVAVKVGGGRSVKLTFTERGLPEIRVPRRYPKYAALQFITKNAEWLQQHSREQIELDIGDMIGDYTVVAEQSKTKSLTLSNKHKRILCGSEADFKSPIFQDELYAMATKVLTKQAEPEIQTMVNNLALLHYLVPTKIRIRAMKSRWGSCTSQGVVTISSFLLQLEPQLANYVINHELAHLVEMNHSSKFWEQLSSQDPNYKAHRKQLRSLNPTLQLNSRPDLESV